MLIDGAGDQFLAGAALAGDEDVDVLRRDPADRLAHLLDDGRAPDDGVPLHLLRQHGGDGHEAGGLEGPVEHAAEALQVERLDEVVEGAALHRLDGGVGSAVGRDEDHRPLRVGVVQFAEQVEAGAVGQLDVEHDHVGPVLGGAAAPLGDGPRRQHRHALAAEDAAEGVLDAGLIVDHKEGRHVIIPPPAVTSP